MKLLSTVVALAMLMPLAQTHANHFETNSYSINVGPTFNFARYKFGSLSKTEGYLAGIHADITHDYACSLFTKLRFDGRWNAGYISGINDRKAKIRDFRPELNIGYSFAFGCCNQLTFTPYTGVGFLYLSSNLSTEAVKRTFHNVYVPVGAKINVMLEECNFDIGLLAEYRIDAWSRLKLITAALGSSRGIKLRRTQGLLVEMPLTWHHETCHDYNFHTKVVPYFDWNQFGAAKVTNSNNIRVPTGKVQQWYLGLHVDLGIQF